ncbi:hypothetical protein DLJ49_18755 [Rhodovulum sp. 12E13]|uniref:hypothetical protein n=1 Tax=Rhodovulum sp. 12E13 TaxID=2203891 RepID=UPI000E19559D|nr:hypothetical protein [Rhodovulum sp. 12E13]RDC69680.1 hypothetical protein DLJ49_18755 [Rhodovulum sp. 12E13]
MAKGSKILRLLFDADTRDALKSVVGLEEGLESASRQAADAQDKLSGVGEGVKEDTQDADKAMRRLGITSESAAKAQIEQLEAAVETVKQAAKEGRATEGDVIRAQERLAQKTERWSRLTATSVERGWLDPLRRAEDRLNRFSARLRSIGAGAARLGGAALAGAGVAGGLAFRSIQSAAEADDALFKLSERTGVALELLTGYSLAAEQADLSTEQLSKAFRKLREAIERDEEMVRSFGLETRNANGELKSQATLFEEAIALLQGMDSEYEKLTVAGELFGRRTGPEMATLINVGVDGIRQYKDLAAELGVELDEGVGRSAIRFNDNLDSLFRSVEAVRRQASRPFYDAFADAFEQVTAVVVENRNALVEFAGVMAERVLSVVEDFVALIEGRRGDVQNAWLIQLVDFAQVLGRVLVDIVIPAITEILRRLEQLGPRWGKIAAGALIIGGAIGPLVTAFIAIAGSVGAIAAKLGAGGAIVAGIKVLAAGVAGIIGTIGLIPTLIAAGVIAAGAAIYKWWDEIVAFFKGAADDVKEAFSSAVTEPLRKALGYAKEVAKVLTPLGPALGLLDAARGQNPLPQLPGFAAGVIGIDGPGTGTSDSILARLSRGESVITARATNFWGEDFLSAVNAMVMPPAFGAIPAALVEAGPRQGGTVVLPIQGPDGVYEGTFDLDTAERLTRDMRRRATTKSIRSPSFMRRRY